MGNEEHLIENALCAWQEVLKGRWTSDYAKEYFKTAKYNENMAHGAGVSLEFIWDIARYVTYVWCEGRIMDEGAGQTKADAIRLMTDKEMAEFLSDHVEPCFFGPASDKGECSMEGCEAERLKWLQQEYKGGRLE